MASRLSVIKATSENNRAREVANRKHEFDAILSRFVVERTCREIFNSENAKPMPTAITNPIDQAEWKKAQLRKTIIIHEEQKDLDAIEVEAMESLISDIKDQFTDLVIEFVPTYKFDADATTLGCHSFPRIILDYSHVE